MEIVSDDLPAPHETFAFFARQNANKEPNGHTVPKFLAKRLAKFSLIHLLPDLQRTDNRRRHETANYGSRTRGARRLP